MTTAETESLPYRYLTPPGPGNPCINDVALDAGQLALAADDGRIRVGCLDDGRVCMGETMTPAGDRVLANAVDILGDVVAVGDHHHRVVRYRIVGSVLVIESVVVLYDGPVNAVAILPSSGEVIAGTYEGSIARIAASGRVLACCSLGAGAVKSISMVDDHTFAFGTAGGRLGRLNLKTGAVAWFPGHDAIVNDVTIGPDRRSLASVGRDFTLRITDVWTGSTVAVVPLARRSPKAVLHCHVDVVHLADYWGWVSAVDLAAGGTSSVRVAGNGVSSLVSDGAVVLAGSYDGSLVTLDPTTLNEVDRVSLWEQGDARWPDAGGAA